MILATAKNVLVSTFDASHTSLTVRSPTPSWIPNRLIIWSSEGCEAMTSLILSCPV